MLLNKQEGDPDREYWVMIAVDSNITRRVINRIFTGEDISA